MQLSQSYKGRCQTENYKQLFLIFRSITIHFKTKKHETFYSLAVAVFRKNKTKWLLVMSY